MKKPKPMIKEEAVNLLLTRKFTYEEIDRELEEARGGKSKYYLISMLLVNNEWDWKKVRHFIMDSFLIDTNSVSAIFRNYKNALANIGVKWEDYEKSFKEAKKNAEKDVKELLTTEAKRAVKKLSGVLDLFNIKSAKTIFEIEELLETNAPITDSTLLLHAKELYYVFKAQALGEIVTRRTTVSYDAVGYDRDTNNIDELPIAENNLGQRLIVETTQSMPPDAKSASMMLVMYEIIQNLQGKTGTYASKDELDREYAKYIDESLRERNAMIARGSNIA